MSMSKQCEDRDRVNGFSEQERKKERERAKSTACMMPESLTSTAQQPSPDSTCGSKAKEAMGQKGRKQIFLRLSSLYLTLNWPVYARRRDQLLPPSLTAASLLSHAVVCLETCIQVWILRFSLDQLHPRDPRGAKSNHTLSGPSRLLTRTHAQAYARPLRPNTPSRSSVSQTRCCCCRRPSHPLPAPLSLSSLPLLC